MLDAQCGRHSPPWTVRTVINNPAGFQFVAITDNYFKLFGLATDFSIDTDQLAGKYRELQRSAHPDRYANAAERDQLLSVQYAAIINDAYQALKWPLSRAVYMLRLRGVDVDKEHSFDLGPGFLMQQIELREELESIRQVPDAAPVLDRMRHELEQHQASLEKSFARSIVDSSAEGLEQAGQAVNKMQFIVKMQQEVERIEDELLGL